MLPAHEWLRRAEDGELDLDEVCLTFDDNLRCQYEIAFPVLRDLGLTAFWFIATATMGGEPNRLEVYRRFRMEHFADVDSFYDAFGRVIEASAYASQVHRGLTAFRVDEYLAAFDFYSDTDRRFRYIRDEILGRLRFEHVMDRMIADSGQSLEQLAKGLWMDAACLRHLHEENHVIGLHSHSHPTRIEYLHPEAQFREYRENYVRLKEVTGESPRTVSHPCNSYNESTLTILRRLGVTAGFRANMELDDLSELEYPRQDHANVLREMQLCASPS
jgi:peptidoglycan/xylan/chitin deacetylase (PgdA/CDA1 family)